MVQRLSLLSSRLPRSLLDYLSSSVSSRHLLGSTFRYCSSSSSQQSDAETQGTGNGIRRADIPNSKVRLRFAPSPTGYLHLGGLRTALFNHLLARKLGGIWILRIEDTDRSRYVPGSVESLIKTLQWAKLSYDEGPEKEGSFGPYVQSERLSIYRRHIDKLIEDKKAYRCFCSPERLAESKAFLKKSGSRATYDRTCLGLSEEEVGEKLNNGEAHVIRFKSAAQEVTTTDLVYGPLTSLIPESDDIILLKSDGMPTYHFASVVDDHEMEVSHVLRGEEWIPSLPKHLALYRAMGWEPPKFAHMPILVNPDGSKLSKRVGDVRVEDYIAKGYEPEALVNFVALMGWNVLASAKERGLGGDDENSEVMPIDELIANFSLESINKHRSTMFIKKLDFLNRSHIYRMMDTEVGMEELICRARPVLAQRFDNAAFTDDYIAKVLKTLRGRLLSLPELSSSFPYFFAPPDLSSRDVKALRKGLSPESQRQAFTEAVDVLSPIPESEFDENAVSQVFRPTSPGLMKSLRYVLTGQKAGPTMSQIVSTLGKEETLSRLQRALSAI